MKNPEVKLLYKYQSLPSDEAERKNKLEAIKNNSVYFASPDEFNDPLDCRIEFKLNKNDMKKFFNFLVQHESIQHEMKVPPEWELAKALQMARQGDKDAKNALERLGKQTDNIFAKIHDAINKSLGIFCLAESPLCSLMWSHYSDSHKGFCVEYERSPGSLLASNTQTFRVRYTNDYPLLAVADLLNTMTAIAGSKGKAIPLEELVLGSICLTKADCWSYEKEWRVIAASKQFVGKANLSRKTVIFGLKTPAEDIKAILEVLPEKVACERVKFKPRSFELMREKLPR
ncbi:MAG: hypothetical protein CVV41_22765 [Candidatus Riflebacteria bacterium HGW-Riflebacteria-1]|jgi:hypothetical protein|nr:MAG: hypothetical protein CVV41_22765 [Candidatus Riflebacteria bacterium HGW-Riflebacteria-1]